jgi:hypothetical protein
MSTADTHPAALEPPADESHLVTYPRFLWECLKISFAGGPLFYGG